MNEIDKKRVLIVDDNPYILKILATMLKLENLEITTAKNGEDALHLIINETEGKFDIIVTDYQMPIINEPHPKQMSRSPRQHRKRDCKEKCGWLVYILRRNQANVFGVQWVIRLVTLINGQYIAFTVGVAMLNQASCGVVKSLKI